MSGIRVRPPLIRARNGPGLPRVSPKNALIRAKHARIQGKTAISRRRETPLIALFLWLKFLETCQRSWIVQNEDMRLQRASGKILIFPTVVIGVRELRIRIHEKRTIARILAGVSSPSENWFLPHPAGRGRIQKNAQNRCSFTQNFRIRSNCPRIAEFPYKSGSPKTLMYVFGRLISARIILWHREMKRRAVLGVELPGNVRDCRRE